MIDFKNKTAKQTLPSDWIKQLVCELVEKRDCIEYCVNVGFDLADVIHGVVRTLPKDNSAKRIISRYLYELIWHELLPPSVKPTAEQLLEMDGRTFKPGKAKTTLLQYMERQGHGIKSKPGKV